MISLKRNLKKPSTEIRLLHYPPQISENGTVLSKRIGVGEHTDFGIITVLAQDSMGGLQVKPRNSDNWIDIKPIPNTLIVNLGDMMSRMTNELYLAATHRVITETFSKSRYSIPFFFDPPYDYIVEPLLSCVDEKCPPKYKPIRYGDYIKGRFEETLLLT